MMKLISLEEEKILKKLFILFIIIGAMFLGGCAQATKMLDKDYYVYLAEEYDTEKDGHYIYILDGYDKNGKERLITFFAPEPLKVGTIVKVNTNYDGYTDDPKVISFEDIPNKAQEKITAKQ